MMFGHRAPTPAADRSPPSNLEAERSVLGSCLLDNRMIDEIVSHGLHSDDFLRDAHAEVWRGILALQSGGGEVDAITLADHLTRRGVFEKLGGDDLLRSLVDSVPHAANALYYAGIVREKAIGRRLIEACTDILRRCYSHQFTADDLLCEAQERILALSDRDAGGATVSYADLVEEVMARMMLRAEDHAAGISCGFPDIDAITCGFRPGELTILAARPGMGKAQPIEAPVLTPTGFCLMADLNPGDFVIGANGRAARVLGVFPQGVKPVFRVRFSDGTSAECCDDHLWFTQTRNERRRGMPGSVKPLKEIRETLRRDAKSTAPNHAVPVVGPVEFGDRGERKGPIHPYLLGLLIGDGTLAKNTIVFSKPEPDLFAKIADLLPPEDAVRIHDDATGLSIKRRQHDNTRSETKQAIERLGLDVDSVAKFVPTSYLYGSVEDRIALLRGLMDTDGHVTESGQLVEFGTSSPRLAEHVEFLARGLGAIVSREERSPRYSYKGEVRDGAPSFRLYVSFRNGMCPVSSAKHLAAWKGGTPFFHKSIVAIEPVREKPCQCISVEAPDGLYVTEDFIVTHNTSLALDLAENVAKGDERGRRDVLFFSIEMGRESLGDRIVAGESGVDSDRFRAAWALNEAERRRLANAANYLLGLPVHVDFTPSRSVGQIAAVARRHRRRHGLWLIVVDYIQLIKAASRGRESREQAVAEISADLKELSRSLCVPVLALGQLNREVEKRADKTPQLADLRESGAIEQDADVVMLLYRPEYYDANARPGVAELHIAKNRNGRTGVVPLAFVAHCTRFDSLAYTDADRAATGADNQPF